jgi:hypothetical protein
MVVRACGQCDEEASSVHPAVLHWRRTVRTSHVTLRGSHEKWRVARGQRVYTQGTHVVEFHILSEGLTSNSWRCVAVTLLFSLFLSFSCESSTVLLAIVLLQLK